MQEFSQCFGLASELPINYLELIAHDEQLYSLPAVHSLHLILQGLHVTLVLGTAK